MLFTKLTTNSSNMNSPKFQQYNTSLLMQITPRPYNRNQFNQQPAPVVSKEIVHSKKMQWGEPTWFLFHTLAEKVKDEYFPSIKRELLNVILIICKNLPCPDCTNHASKYLESVNFNAIQTKQQLKEMLFVFHNMVNKRKHFELFTIDELNSKYASANTVLIINNFLEYYQDKQFGARMIANDFHRNMAVDVIKKWLGENITKFDV